MDIRKELIGIFNRYNAAERLEHQAHMRGDDRRSKIKSKEMHNLNKKFWFILRKKGVDVPKPKDRDIGLYGNLTTSPSDFVDGWLNEAVVQRGTNDVYGDAPSDMGSDNEDSILANDEYGQDKDEKNLVKESDNQIDVELFLRGELEWPLSHMRGRRSESIEEAEPVRSEKDIALLRKLGYSEERIARIDRSESEVIIMNRIQAKKSGSRKTKWRPDRRRHESIKEKSEAFWTEVNENLFTKASMTLGKTFLPNDDEVEDEEDIDEDHNDQYNVTARPATPGHETWVDTARYEDVVFLQGEEADKAIEIIQRDGPDAGIKFLSQWHYPGEHMTRDELPHGTNDNVHHDNGYILFWNNMLPYAGLTFDSTIDEEPPKDRSKSVRGVAPAQTGPKAGSAAQRSLDRIVKKHGGHK